VDTDLWESFTLALPLAEEKFAQYNNSDLCRRAFQWCGFRVATKVSFDLLENHLNRTYSYPEPVNKLVVGLGASIPNDETMDILMNIVDWSPWRIGLTISSWEEYINIYDVKVSRRTERRAFDFSSLWTNLIAMISAFIALFSFEIFFLSGFSYLKAKVFA